MGTRAIYIFEDEHEEVAVYKHYDNYPLGAADFIENAKSHAWTLPRFEAGEFGAAFVSANKNQGGGEVRLVQYNKYSCRDDMVWDYTWCDYYYVISYQSNHKDLWVEIWQSRYDMDSSDTYWVLVDALTHTQMKEKYGRSAA
jgi:hypothetical protein